MLTEELEYFGPGSFQYQLDEAYKNFVAFCRSRRLDHSQPPFKASKVPGNQSGIWAHCLPVSGVLLHNFHLVPLELKLVFTHLDQPSQGEISKRNSIERKGLEWENRPSLAG